MNPDLLDLLQMGLSGFFIIFGVFFVIAGAIGVLRLPDFYTRMHAAGMTDTLGAEFIIVGLMVQAGFSQTSLKLMLIGFFLFVASPTASHAVANAAYQAGLKPLLGKRRARDPSKVFSKDAGETK